MPMPPSSGNAFPYMTRRKVEVKLHSVSKSMHATTAFPGKSPGKGKGKFHPRAGNEGPEGE
jgi:hypothetical protein